MILNARPIFVPTLFSLVCIYQLHVQLPGRNCREAIQAGRADFTPIFLSEIPHLFRRKHVELDLAIISITPPDKHGFCSLGPSVDVTRSAIQNAKFIVGMFLY